MMNFQIKLEETVPSTNRNDYMIGHLNNHVGSEQLGQEDIHEEHSYRIRKAVEREQIIGSVVTLDLILCNTLH